MLGSGNAQEVKEAEPEQDQAHSALCELGDIGDLREGAVAVTEVPLVLSHPTRKASETHVHCQEQLFIADQKFGHAELPSVEIIMFWQ